MQKQNYTVICPRCGVEFDEKEKFCPHCDTPNRKMICRSCGAQINASERVCKVCGAKNRRKTGFSRNFILIGATVLAALGILLFPKQPKQADQPPAQAQEAVSQTPETPEQSIAQDAPEQSSQSFNVEKHSGTLFSGGTVEITIPSDYIGEDITQDELDAKVEQADGFKSATLNADGSVTYIMTEACHKKLMKDMAQQLDSSLADMVGSEDYPNVTAIDASDDYTKFTVTLSSGTVNLQESLMTLVFYMSGGLYHYFSTGEPVDNINVRFIDQSGNLLQEANSKDVNPDALSSISTHAPAGGATAIFHKSVMRFCGKLPKDDTVLCLASFGFPRRDPKAVYLAWISCANLPQKCVREGLALKDQGTSCFHEGLASHAFDPVLV